MDGPCIDAEQHRLKDKFPYAHYVWNRDIQYFELWLEDLRGQPYKDMVLTTPGGAFRLPGEWVLDHLRETDGETGAMHNRHSTMAERGAWIQSMTDYKYLEKKEANRRSRRTELLRADARFHFKHGRVFDAAHVEG